MVEHCEKDHVVRQGESLPGIAARAVDECYGKPRTPQEWPERVRAVNAEMNLIVDLNGITNPDLLHSGNKDAHRGPLKAGQVLVIPNPENLYHK